MPAENVSAMGPIDEEPRGLQGKLESIRDEDPDASVFVDPPDFEDSSAPRRSMPKIDLAALGARTHAVTQDAAKRRMMAEVAPLYNQAQQIEQELARLAKDDFGDESRKQELLNQRQQIANTMNGPLRMANELVTKQMGTEARSIIQLQEAAASEFPEVADEVLDLASQMTLEQQASPVTYRLLAQQVYGEHVMSGRHRGNISSVGANSGLVGGRSGTQGGPRYEVSSQDVRKLRNMGLKGKSLSEAIDRLSR